VTDTVSQRPVVVVEDSDEDYEVTVWALRKAGAANPVRRCANAAAIADLLTGRSGLFGSTPASHPLLVLLDLNLPGRNGLETLRDLRGDSRWQTVPVVIVSTSKSPAEVSACYRLGAAGYLAKPLDLDAFAAAMRRLVAYWMETVVPAVPDDLSAHEILAGGKP